ncbi:hypothetical protein ACKKBG_A10510 [Auxenochlorella protothecoides x Auxenochlorella symbiontica]
MGKAALVPSPVPMGGKAWLHGDPHQRYRFLRVLGTGHFAAVYLCSHLGTGELVAIKALDKHHPEFERHTALEEVRVLAAVQDHHNVVTLYEVWEDASYIFLVQEACLGGELFDLVVQNKAFSEQDAAKTIAAVLSMVSHCHARGILCRDLKPENWLLKRSESSVHPENLRAVDFGLSTFHHPTAPCTERVGSSYYVAPEVLQGSYSWPADLWSVGVMAYVLLSGFPPFWGSSDPVIYHRILHDDLDFGYEPWQAVSATAKDFVASLLRRDPAQRATLADARAHPWIADAPALPSAPLLPEVLDRISAFTRQTRLHKLLLTVAARHLGGAALGALRDVFKTLDTDGDGLISLGDLTAALRAAGVDLAAAEVAGLVDSLDGAFDGRIAVDEFLAAALDQRKVLSAKAVNAVFAALDRDGDGLVGVEELAFVLEECRVEVDPEALRRMMRGEGALDRSGMVSAASFQNLLLGGEAGEAAAPLAIEAYLRDVRRFAAASAFKKLAMLVIARQLDAAEVGALRDLFASLDPCGSGVLTLRQLRAALGGRVADPDLAAALEVLDLKRRGTHVDFDEFLAAALEEQQLVTETKMRAAFDYFDKDALGVITPDQLGSVLRDVGMQHGDVQGLLASAGGGKARQPSTLTYQDFRRVVLDQAPNILTCCSPRSSLDEGRPEGQASSGSGPEGTPGSPIRELAGMIDEAWEPRLDTPLDLPCSPLHGRRGEAALGSVAGSASFSEWVATGSAAFRHRDTAPAPAPGAARKDTLLSGTPHGAQASPPPRGRAAEARSPGARGAKPTVLQSMLQKLVRGSSRTPRRGGVDRTSTISSASDGSTAAYLAGD